MNSSLPKLISLLALLLWAGIFCAVGCGKIKNPEARPDKRRSWLFFNYSVQNPHAHPAAALTNLTQNFSGQILRALLMTNFIPPSIFKEFAEDTGATWDVTLVSTPEEIIRRIEAGEKYDITMGPGYLVQRFIADHRLHTLNHNNISNLLRIEDRFQTNVFDPKQMFGVPYLWSVAGIAYNSDHFQAPPARWSELFEPPEARRAELEGKIAFLPGPYRAAATVLVHNTNSPNTLSTNDILQAVGLLITNAPKLRFQFLPSDLLARAMASNEVLIAQCYGFDAVRIDRMNPKVDFAVPNDGTWITFDFLMIPVTRDLKRAAMAETFINFLLDPRIAATVVTNSLHASCIQEARSFIPAEMRHGPAYMHTDTTTGPLYVQTFEKALSPLREQLWIDLQKAASAPQSTNDAAASPGR